MRISLGGVRDEAEIRGHRRTYVGAMPGRIIQGIHQAGSSNPIFMLDEIDKLGADYRGDPSAALLEVLDPEQNYSFRDHYLGVPYDLSKVMFIATANLLDPIHPAFRDRMEVIHLSGYTRGEEGDREDAPDPEADRRERPHEAEPEFTDCGHREAHRGVHARGGPAQPRAAVRRDLPEGRAHGGRREDAASTASRPPIRREVAGAASALRARSRSRRDQVGVATGLAWTAIGGDILHIEASTMKGKGGLLLTGQLGDVMKESAQAALSYARAHASELGIQETSSRRTTCTSTCRRARSPRTAPRPASRWRRP